MKRWMADDTLILLEQQDDAKLRDGEKIPNVRLPKIINMGYPIADYV
jgi:hypothetical protein